MSIYWPLGLPPYTASTHITDRTTPLNHYSIMNGLAKDIGALQHNINTTNLFASGYANPVMSGHFLNIDTNYLYAQYIVTNTGYMTNIDSKNIDSISYKTPLYNVNVFTTNNSAFINNNFQIRNTFRSYDNSFILNSVNFIYNAIEISGGLYDYYFKPTDRYDFINGTFGQLIINSGNINISSNHKTIIENMHSFNPSGSLNESNIIWGSNHGHNHINNKINSNYIVNGDLTIEGSLNINNSLGSIDIISGVLNASSYNLQTYFEPTEFYLLDFSGEGTYTCDRPNLTGKVSSLDIGTSQIISYGDTVFATSITPPEGLSDLTKTYIYKSTDLFNWTGILASGSTWTPQVRGVASIDAFTISNGSLYAAWNCAVNGANYAHVMKYDSVTDFNTSGIFYSSGVFAHGSSRYILGLANIENSLMTFGYEYPHVYSEGIPKWDKHVATNPYNDSPDIKPVLYNDGLTADLVMEQDTSFKDKPYKYSYPFVQCFKGDFTQKFWVDGTYNGREPYLTHIDNGDVYDMLNKYNSSIASSSFFGGLFGNGFSEVTAMLSTTMMYHNGYRCSYSSRRTIVDDYTCCDIVRDTHYSESPILVFGSASTSVNTNNGVIFGGCIPLLYDINKKMLPNTWVNGTIYSNVNTIVTSGNADYAPMFLNGSHSLIDNIDLFRIPSYSYSDLNPIVEDRVGISTASFITTNYIPLCNYIGTLYGDDVGPVLWSDFSNITTQRTELINYCPWLPSLLVFPFGGSGCIYYKNETDKVPIKLDYTLSNNDNGLIIPNGTFNNHRNYPIYKDRTNKNGFWSSKKFSWYYQTPNFETNKSKYINPPNGNYTPTNYYMRPKCPVQLNGSIYNILEYNSGFVYTGPNGSEYKDDNIYYSDLIKFGNTLYGVGVDLDNVLKVMQIKRNISTEIKVNVTLSGVRYTPKFLIHKNKLYIGIGNGRFIVKKPSHLDLCITSNL